MREKLLGYLLGELQPEQRQRVEAALAEDPALRAELARLRACLQDRQAASEATDPPTDLAGRTSRMVARFATSGKWPTSSSCATRLGGEGSSWRKTDIAVAAGVCLAVATLIVPALRASREAARLTVCENHLRQVGLALGCYSSRHDGQLPLVGIHDPAGIFTVKLVDSGCADRDELQQWVVCPSSSLAGDIHAGHAVVRIPTRQEIERANGIKRAMLERLMGGTYSYRLGYWKSNHYVGIQLPDRNREPLLADAPEYRAGQPKVVNHRCGQNVLYPDFSVRHQVDCLTADGGDNLFVNDDGQRAAGRSPHDVVLATSQDRPSGPGSWKSPISHQDAPFFADQK